MTTRSLGTLTVDLVAKIGGFVRGMTQAERVADKHAKRIDKHLSDLRASAKRFGVAFGAALVTGVTSLAVLTKNSIDAADRIDELSQRLGISTETLSGWEYAAKLSGTSLDALTNAIPKLSKNLAAAQVEGSRFAQLFEALEVSTTDASGNLRQADQVMLDLADRFQSMDNETMKAALALEVFGRSGAELLEFLGRGSSGIEDLTDRAAELGIVIGPETAASAAEFNDRLDDMRALAHGLGVQLAQRLLPAMTDLVERFSDFVRDGQGAAGIASSIERGFRGLADGAVAVHATVRGLTLQLVAMYEVALALHSIGFFGGFDVAGAKERFANARVALDMSAGENTRARNALTGNRPAAAPVIEWIDPPPSGPAPLKTDAADPPPSGPAPLKTDAAEREAESARREAEAERRKQDEEAARALMERTRAQLGLLAATEDLRAEMEGPLAQVQLDYIRREDELIELGKLAGLGHEEMAESLELLERARLRDVAAIEAQNAAQREYEEALKNAEAIRALDDFRSSFEDNVASVLDGTKSVRDALRDMVADFIRQMARLAAQRLTDSLFGEPGTQGSGGFGSMLAGFFGKWFGGGRATGGSIFPGKAYLVGEEGPELIRPLGAAMVTSAPETARAMGRSFTQVNQFNMPGRYDLRTQGQIAADAGRAGRLAMTRSTA